MVMTPHPPRAVYGDFDVIGIDEGQFFGDLVSFCETAANAGKIVIVAGLDGDFKAEPFGTICDLVPLAEKVDKLCAVCAVSGAGQQRRSRTTHALRATLRGATFRSLEKAISYYSDATPPRQPLFSHSFPTYSNNAAGQP